MCTCTQSSIHAIREAHSLHCCLCVSRSSKLSTCFAFKVSHYWMVGALLPVSQNAILSLELDLCDFVGFAMVCLFQLVYTCMPLKYWLCGHIVCILCDVSS